MLKRILLLFVFVGGTFAGFSQSQPSKAKLGSRPDLPGDLMLHYGVHMLPGASDAMGIKIMPSQSFGLRYLYPIKFGESHFSFHAGLGLDYEKYMPKGDKTLAYGKDTNGDPQLQLVKADSIVGGNASIRKSKYEADYLDIPLEFRWRSRDEFNKGISIAVGGYVGVLFSAKTKIKYREDNQTKKLKNKQNFELNNYRYGVHGRLGLGAFGAYFNYQLSDLFGDKKGPNNGESLTPLSFGLTYNLF